jgi:nucleotide-binding universal stress UspA family protein
VKKTMKLLIAYDGTTSADTALDDLLRAGLPAEANAIVISVADIFMPRAASSSGDAPAAALKNYNPSVVEHRLEQVAHALEEARRWATNASKRLHAQFPSWKVQTEVCGHSPAWAIVEKADEWKPDLVVLGSHNRSALGQLFLGSISQTVLSEARCSVRIARSRLAKDPTPGQILIGVDGSASAALAVAEVASRPWPPDTKAHLVAVLDHAMTTALNWTEDGFENELTWIENLLATSTAKLQVCGLRVSAVVKKGLPKEVLVEEAERVNSDCIFLGARGLRRLERFLLGSVSTAVATRARCSVEIVRPR